MGGGAQGAVGVIGALLKGTSVMVLRVERVLDIHSPHLQSLPDLRLEPVTQGLVTDYDANPSLYPLGHNCPHPPFIFYTFT